MNDNFETAKQRFAANCQKTQGHDEVMWNMNQGLYELIEGLEKELHQLREQAQRHR